jgi:hypothetical protein
MSRHTLHELVDRIPEEEISAAQRFLQLCLRRRMTNLSALGTRTQCTARIRLEVKFAWPESGRDELRASTAMHLPNTAPLT